MPHWERDPETDAWYLIGPRGETPGTLPPPPPARIHAYSPRGEARRLARDRAAWAVAVLIPVAVAAVVVLKLAVHTTRGGE